MAGEPSRTLWFEHALYTAVFIGGITWVLHGLAFVTSWQALKRARVESGRQTRLSLWLISVLYGLSTASLFCSFNLNQRTLIDEWPFAGGPLKSYHAHYLDLDNVVAFAAGLASMVLAYMHLIRCFYRTFRPRRKVLALFLTGTMALLLCAGIFEHIYCFVLMQEALRKYISPPQEGHPQLLLGRILLSYAIQVIFGAVNMCIPSEQKKSHAAHSYVARAPDPALGLARSVINRLLPCQALGVVVITAGLWTGFGNGANVVDVIMTAVFVQALPASVALIVAAFASAEDSVFSSPSHLDKSLLPAA